MLKNQSLSLNDFHLNKTNKIYSNKVLNCVNFSVHASILYAILLLLIILFTYHILIQNGYNYHYIFMY